MAIVFKSKYSKPYVFFIHYMESSQFIIGS